MRWVVVIISIVIVSFIGAAMLGAVRTYGAWVIAPFLLFVVWFNLVMATPGERRDAVTGLTDWWHRRRRTSARRPRERE